jgi:hypothetical protein
MDERQADKAGERCGAMALIVGGIAPLKFKLRDALDMDGAYVLTGIPGGDHPLQIPGASLVRQVVLKNELMPGSGNAARGHFQMGANHLQQDHLKWCAFPDQLATLFMAWQGNHEPNSIKVVEWTRASPLA